MESVPGLRTETERFLDEIFVTCEDHSLEGKKDNARNVPAIVTLTIKLRSKVRKKSNLLNLLLFKSKDESQKSLTTTVRHWLVTLEVNK